MPITDHSECVRQAHPSSFFGDELLRALTEESFGIKAFSTIATTQLQATASVTLLEGQTIHIKLETRGYSIECIGDGCALPSNEDTIFESLDEFLRSASPMYEQMRHDALVKKLEGLV
ncbi:hypothetical protein L208DRAFT_1285518 [Tricholoma matsutake]|nr:hypothetical protein L208DRAFT_1285518 [Tricholoma matsutake 945]